MRKISVIFAFILPVILLSLSPIHSNTELHNYYSFRQLRKASTPMHMKVLKPANSSFGRPSIQEGVLITYKNRRARRVKLAGSFS